MIPHYTKYNQNQWLKDRQSIHRFDMGKKTYINSKVTISSISIIIKYDKFVYRDKILE